MKTFATIGLALLTMSGHLFGFNVNKEKGMWNGKDAALKHIFDPGLARGLAKMLRSEEDTSIVDFGCGMGYYIRHLHREGFDVSGYDGNPNTLELTDGFCKVIDLSEPFDLGRRYDWVMSIEVGEHIPKKFERIFIKNLIRHCKKGIVLSWAIKGQRGDGHVNCQNNDYIKEVMASYGFRNDLDTELFLRAQLSKFRFLKKTIMVFRPE